MPKIEREFSKTIQGSTYAVDSKGYLKPGQRVDAKWMDQIAREEGIGELTHEHRVVIEALQSFQQKKGTIPTAAELSRITGLKIRHCHDLFPRGGPGACACKIAGISRGNGIRDGRLPRNNRDRLIAKARYEAEEFVTVASVGDDEPGAGGGRADGGDIGGIQ